MSDMADEAKLSRAGLDKFELTLLLETINLFEPERIIVLHAENGQLIKTLRRSYPQARVVAVDNSFEDLEFTDFYAIVGDPKAPSMLEAVRDALRGHLADVLIMLDPDEHLLESYKKLLGDQALIVMMAATEVFHSFQEKHPSAEFYNGPEETPGLGIIFL